MSSQTKICNHHPIQANLRIWLSPIAHGPVGVGALPPGVELPRPQQPRSETHALNLELSLENKSDRQQSVSVLGWRWHQGSQTQQAHWAHQPDMSPLNRYSQVQQYLIKLDEAATISVDMDLEINGEPCHLEAQ